MMKRGLVESVDGKYESSIHQYIIRLDVCNDSVHLFKWRRRSHVVGEDCISLLCLRKDQAVMMRTGRRLSYAKAEKTKLPDAVCVFPWQQPLESIGLSDNSFVLCLSCFRGV